MRVKDLVEMLFGGVPYSREAAAAQETIEASLKRELENAPGEPAQAMGSVMTRWGTLRDAATLAGYTEEDVAAWESRAGLLDETRMKQLWHRTIFMAWAAALVLTLGVYCLAATHVTTGEAQYILAAGCAAAAAGLLMGFNRMTRPLRLERVRLDAGAAEYLRREEDRNAKRLLDAVWLLGAAMGGIITVYRLPEAELPQFEIMWITCAVWVGTGLVLLLKNMLLYRTATRAFIPDGRRKNLIIQAVGCGVFAGAYWLLMMELAYVTETGWLSAVKWAIYILCAAVYLLKLRPKAVRENITIAPRRLIAVCTAAALVFALQKMRADTWLLQPYIAQVSPIEYQADAIRYSDEDGTYTITTGKREFRILQLTDIHIGGSATTLRKDEKALRACQTIIEHTKPDLVIVTGDLCYPVGILSNTLNNTAAVTEFAAFMRNIGVPWAFTYGNHDTESYATSNRWEIDELYRSLSWRTSGSLLYPYDQPAITGRNNQVIRLEGMDGKLIQALILLDSNDYIGHQLNNYDYIHDDQVKWYAEKITELSEREGRTAPSMLFFHIPLEEYRRAYTLYQKGSDEVKYFFGENTQELGGMFGCSKYPSGLFEKAVELGSTKAMFCGHDHMNNMSLEYEGIRLTYGMSIDYLSAPGMEQYVDQRGGTLITVQQDGTFEIQQVPLRSVEPK